MTEQHPALAFLLAAQGSAVDLANSATPGPWYANEYDIDMQGFAASIGTRPDDVRCPCGVLGAASDIVGNGYEGGGVVGLGDAQFIASQPPENVLRRVEAERELLADHQPQRYANVPTHETCADLNCDCYEEIATCGTCAPGHYYDADPQPWPCATVLLIAKGWGWTA